MLPGIPVHQGLITHSIDTRHPPTALAVTLKYLRSHPEWWRSSGVIARAEGAELYNNVRCAISEHRILRATRRPASPAALSWVPLLSLSTFNFDTRQPDSSPDDEGLPSNKKPRGGSPPTTEPPPPPPPHPHSTLQIRSCA